MKFVSVKSPEVRPSFKREIILEVELSGKISFDGLLNIIYHDFGIPYKIISADIEFVAEKSYGSVQLFLETEVEKYESLEFYLNRQRILHVSVEKISRKAV